MNTIRGKHDVIRWGEPDEETPAQSIGTQIQEMRADRQVNMRQFAALLGIAPCLLSDIENGHRPVEETQEVLDRTKKLLEGELPE